ncbi:NADPH quinone reductase [Flavobacteriaceae bacterium CRH]|nr:NADPH quinone reductase [Flavobacteriaceae bacterium CRH]
MKAIQYLAFGDSSVLKLKTVDKPKPKANEVIIKVEAFSVNPVDMKIRQGFLQDTRPVQLPFIPGLDAAGFVDAVGENVTKFKKGDRVVGNGYNGTYAEYASFPENHISFIPSNISFQEASALSIGLITAYTFLIEHGKVKKGDSILIHGAAGGTGIILVQMAKALGAYVIGTDSSSGIELAKSMGADEMIDYKNQDFKEMVKDVDLVIDFVGGQTQTDSFRTLKRRGKLLSAVSFPSQEMAEKYEIESKFLIASLSSENLDYGLKMASIGIIKPIISKTMSFENAAEAQDILSKGGLKGKIILESSYTVALETF